MRHSSVSILVRQDGVGDMYPDSGVVSAAFGRCVHPGLHGGTGQRADMNIARN